MVVQGDEYPGFPKIECSVCGERFEVPRQWVAMRGIGNQIIIDWTANEMLMKAHHAEHNNDLIYGLELMLKEDANRKGI